MRTRYLVTAAAALAASVLPIQAAHAATSCFGKTAQYAGNSKANTVLVHVNLSVVHMGGGDDTVAGDPGSGTPAIICLGDGRDTVKSASSKSGPGAVVAKLDGGSGKDYATIEACFDEVGLTEIVVRDVERLTIVSCPQRLFEEH